MDHSKFNNINTFVFDVDGVLTDSSLLITDQGELLRTVSAKDGMGIRFAIDAGYNVAIITGGKSPGVKDRFIALGVKDYYDNAWDKVSVLEKYRSEKDIELSQILYMGDDINDLQVLKKVGISSCPNNAVADVLSICNYVSSKGGGKGCAREVIEKVMRIQNKWIT
jgi:3-deoxy-D-manno-octulosonate 8-phosphate phosphatase (KDO 8-P phosphatase)